MTALIDQVDTLLKANLPSFSTIEKSWTVKPIEDFDSDTPAALYYLAGIQSQPSPFDTEVIQPSETTITILIVCEIDSLDALRNELLTAMVGFEPTGTSYDVFEHVSGQSLDIDGIIVWWSDSFVVTSYRSQA